MIGTTMAFVFLPLIVVGMTLMICMTLERMMPTAMTMSKTILPWGIVIASLLLLLLLQLLNQQHPREWENIHIIEAARTTLTTTLR
jgi:hypothetical protein